ncbi:Predicted branched-chain amino acid permease (azaleucine resistance) [Lachnospiraceae bacterium NE2001]|nr:Predicted branched-chain amino acid permease (azaleucine resistance) [Lachnospiraceae bacterium NE2001]
MNKTMKNYRRGLMAGIPIALGYLSVSFTFGIIAVQYGLTVWEATLISMTTVTSAGQFAGVKIMMVPGLWLDMLISQLTINVRYSFMSIALSQKLDKKFSGIWRWLLAFMVTDEIFAVGITEEKLTRSFWLGLSTLPWIGWSLGTFLGAFLGNVLPASVMSALGLALYGMFVAIVVPEMKKEKAVIIAVIIAALLSTAFTYVPILNKVSVGISISICAIASAVIVAILFPVDDDDPDSEGGAL